MGAVLTGGASRRMGRTKALIEIDGVPMAARVAAALRGAGCVSVVAYGGDPVELEPVGMPVLPDRYPDAGPLGGVLGVLELFDADDVGGAGRTGRTGRTAVAGVFIVACDLPALTAGDLAGMVGSVRAHPDADVVVARTSAIEPACAIWNPLAVERIRRCFGEGVRAMHVAIERLRSVEVDLDPAALRNINTPEDLGRYS